MRIAIVAVATAFVAILIATTPASHDPALRDLAATSSAERAWNDRVALYERCRATNRPVVRLTKDVALTYSRTAELALMTRCVDPGARAVPATVVASARDAGN